MYVRACVLYRQPILTLNASDVARTLLVTAFCGSSSIAKEEFFKDESNLSYNTHFKLCQQRFSKRKYLRLYVKSRFIFFIACVLVL